MSDSQMSRERAAQIAANTQEGYKGFRPIIFANFEMAFKVYSELPLETKLQMAVVYQQAFAGSPWFEVGKCPNCGKFATALNVPCENCQTLTTEAYPIVDLIAEYFPRMLSQYTPGMLAFATDEGGNIIGWTCGGFKQLDALISNKYVNNTVILDSIVRETGVAPDELVFYDNETCILPELQNQGCGKVLGDIRLKAATLLCANTILGRTVNVPWLIVKSRALTAAGYNFSTFVPEGDDYKIGEAGRAVYIATKVNG